MATRSEMGGNCEYIYLNGENSMSAASERDKAWTNKWMSAKLPRELENRDSYVRMCGQLRGVAQST